MNILSLYRQSFLIILSVFFTTSCKTEKGELRLLLEEFEKTQIVLPSDMIMIKEGKICPYLKRDHKDMNTMVFYIGEGECSDCRISHLWDYSELFELSQETGTFEIMIIFSPIEEDISYVQDRILSTQFSYPVYLDIHSLFSELNKLPDDIRFHTFLLDSDGYPILIGNPLNNKRIRTLFNHIIKF